MPCPVGILSKVCLLIRLVTHFPTGPLKAKFQAKIYFGLTLPNFDKKTLIKPNYFIYLLLSYYLSSEILISNYSFEDRLIVPHENIKKNYSNFTDLLSMFQLYHSISING